jgi:filamentous hemagglutinin
MNRNRYRIIFNQSRGQLMAVAENVSSQSKSAGETEGSSSPSLFGSSRLFKISKLTLAFALGMSSFNSSYAEIIADRNAPANQQATILRDAAGKPLVNIQSPSAAGVSRNTYTKFDIDAQGVTLNNDRGSNPWLAKGDARVILNEVNSSNPSLLAGAITVRGSRAEVIVANPSGINVNGVSIENASRLTLTTGKAISNNGQLTGIQVSQGGIVVEGAGLNASSADYTELLSRTASIQAKISAKQLAVTTGAQTLDYTSGTLSTENATGAKPVLALDVSQLGGMYAGKISLLSTEAGIGVRNAGTLEANQLVLTADGKLENSGKISAAVTSIATVSGDIENRGSINGRDFLMISAGNNANLSGVGMKQDSAAMVLLAKADINLAAGTQIGSNKASSTLSLTAGRDINLAKQSSLAAQGAISLNSDGKLNSTEASIVTQSDSITAVAGNGIDLHSSQLNAAKKIQLETGKPFAETNAAVQLNASKLTASEQINVISTGDLTLTSSASSATAGAAHVVLLSNRKVQLDAGSKLDAGGNLYIKAGESVLLQGDAATSQKVALSAKGQIDLHGASVELQASHIRSTGVNADLNMSASTGSLAINTLLTPDLTRANGAIIEAGGKVNINTLAADLSVSGAKISGQTVSLLSAGHLGITGDEMASSELMGKQGLTLATVKGVDSLLYSDGRVKLDAGQGELWFSASGAANISGHNLQTVDGQGVVATAFTPNSMRGASVRIDAKSDIDVSGTDVTATAGDIGWYTKGNFNFTSYGNQPAEYGLNGNGRLNASGNVRIHADANVSVSGISATVGKSLALTSATANAYLDNSLLQAGDVLSVATLGSQSHTFSHLNGGALLLRSEKDKINVQQSQLKTSATRSADVAQLSGQLSIDTAGTLEWDAASLISAGTDLSLLAGSGDITLSATNTGNLQAGRDLAFSTGSGNLTLAAGFNWSAKRDLSLKSKSGKLILLGTAGNQGSPSAQIVTLKAGGAMSLTGAQVDIQASKLSSNGAMKITSTASDVYINGIKNSLNNYVPTQRIQHVQNQVNQITAEIKTLETPEYILLSSPA